MDSSASPLRTAAQATLADLEAAVQGHLSEFEQQVVGQRDVQAATRFEVRLAEDVARLLHDYYGDRLE